MFVCSCVRVVVFVFVAVVFVRDRVLVCSCSCSWRLIEAALTTVVADSINNAGGLKNYGKWFMGYD